MLRFERLMTGMLLSSQNMLPVFARDSSGLLDGKPCTKKKGRLSIPSSLSPLPDLDLSTAPRVTFDAQRSLWHF